MGPNEKQKIEIEKLHRDPLPPLNQAVKADYSDFLGTALIRFDSSIPFVLNCWNSVGYHWTGCSRAGKEDDMVLQTSWKELYLRAVLESDKEQLTGLVEATEQAIALRAQELLKSTDHHEERGEMAIAQESLLSIKTHKLGWPPVSARDGLR